MPTRNFLGTLLKKNLSIPPSSLASSLRLSNRVRRGNNLPDDRQVVGFFNIFHTIYRAMIIIWASKFKLVPNQAFSVDSIGIY